MFNILYGVACILFIVITLVIVVYTVHRPYMKAPIEQFDVTVVEKYVSGNGRNSITYYCVVFEAPQERIMIRFKFDQYGQYQVGDTGRLSIKRYRGFNYLINFVRST
jgi:hypothetical protein